MSRYTRMLTIAAIFTAGCSGGDGSATGPLPPGSMPPPAGNPFAPLFSEIQENVLTPTCAVAGCHRGAGAPQGLRLDAANSYGLLVDVASSEDPDVLRVAPFDPGNSYLVRKLEGTASVGERMPLGGPPLEQPVIDVIRQWITDGATDDRAPSSSAIRVSSISPFPGEVLNDAPAEIVAMFDREIDSSTLHIMTFIVEGSGGDGSFNDGNEIVVTPEAITAPTIQPRKATFRLGDSPLASDVYRVVLRGAGPSLVMDIDANALDGEFTAVFPSGDGVGGGDFQSTFSVESPDPRDSAPDASRQPESARNFALKPDESITGAIRQRTASGAKR